DLSAAPIPKNPAQHHPAYANILKMKTYCTIAGRTTSLLFLFVLFTTAGFTQAISDRKDSLVKLEVLSVRLASAEERQSDNIGMDVIVRFRLSNKGRRTVQFYTSWEKYISPTGYTIQRCQDQTEWFVGFEKTSEKSPGIEKLMRSGDGGAWLSLTSNMAIEFEQFDSTTRTCGKHAQTFFIRTDAKGATSEMSSDVYEIPAKAK
ncbi:MAG: hypothetical protein WBB81_11525, partial [Pyrinomonadaceae bacterium]